MLYTSRYCICNSIDEYNYAHSIWRRLLEETRVDQQFFPVLLKIKRPLGTFLYGEDHISAAYPDMKAINCFICDRDLIPVVKYPVEPDYNGIKMQEYYYWADPNGDTSNEVKFAMERLVPIAITDSKPWKRIDFSSRINGDVPKDMFYREINHDSTAFELRAMGY